MEKPLEGFEKDERFVRNRLRPKDAATLVLVRHDKDVARVLMGKRHGGMAFMANKVVFPGGRVDPCDARLKVGGAFKTHVAQRLLRETNELHGRALALAAIRETFEETGFLVGEHSEIVPRSKSAWSLFFGQGVVPKLDQLDYIARAITPPNRPRRFDARFFMADAASIAGEVPAADPNELLTPCWLTFSEARAIDIPAITRAVLAEAEARVMEDNSPARPVPFFRFVRGKSRLDRL